MEPQQPQGMNVSPLIVDCPFCGERLTFLPSQAGAAVSCPKCFGKFQVPLPTARNAAGTGNFGPAESSEYRDFVNKKILVGVLGIVLGGLGIHKFVLGLNTAGVIMLSVWLIGMVTGICIVVPIFASMAMGVIGLVEGIIYLTKSDEDFYQTYAVEKKEWF